MDKIIMIINTNEILGELWRVNVHVIFTSKKTTIDVLIAQMQK